MQILQLDEFLRSIKQNIDTPHSLLLGAGASIESGIPSAADCIWDWKREIYLSQNPGAIGNFDNSKSEGVRRVIQRWIDSQNIYPAENSAEEYSYFAEKAYPIADDRRKYFQHLVSNHDPSLGYHLISLLALENIIKSVWTTNFDGMTLKCAHQYSPLVPIEITAETSGRIYRGDVDKELLCIALHGDYKYGALKNTEKELDSQDGELVKALLHELTNRDLIVMGYSGRDQSLMNALQQVYSTKGSGKLFWCGYGTRVSSEVKALVEMANKNGRAAFYIPTEGFDSTIYAIARHCMSENREFLGKVDDIKKKLSITLEPQHSGFLQPDLTINKVVSTNAFPIAFPNQCYQFEVLLAPGEKQWDFCKMLVRDDVMAVPYKNLVYAWGSKSVIEEACKGRLKTNIELCPLSRATIAGNSTFRELLLKTLVRILAASHGLGHSKDKIWDTKEVLKYRIGAKTVTAYSGVRLALLFDNKYSYLTLVPSFMYADDAVLTREEKKQFADWFNARVNNGRPNQNANEYIRKWVRKVIGNKRFSANYPLGSTTNFTFSVVNSSALVGVNFGKQASIQLPVTISPKRIIFSGIEYRDPTLRFCGTL